jgi:hypothetical protein
MASLERNNYIVALYAVAKTDPAKWANFVEAFRAYTIYELERITSATQDTAGIAIGFGRKMKEQRDDFNDIESLMDKIRK